MTMKKRIAAVALALIVGFCMVAPTKISHGKSTDAEKALANALASGKIDYNKYMNYNIADFDGDGNKDLFLATDGQAYIYSYVSGAVKQILKPFSVEYVLAYDSKKKVFWMWGDGDGGWCYAYKLKNNKLTLSCKYVCRWKGGKIVFEYKKKGHKTKRISKKKYMSACKYAEKWYKQTSKKNIIKMLDPEESNPSASEDGVYTIDASVIDNYGQDGNSFYVEAVDGWEFGKRPYCGWGEATKASKDTGLKYISFEMDDDCIYTQHNVDSTDDEYDEISYEEFSSYISDAQQYSVNFGVEIYVIDGKIYRLGIQCS